MATSTVTPTTSDTVDITALVENTRASFVTWAVDFVFAACVAIPGAGPVIAAPFISAIAKGILTFIIGTLSKSAVMMAFFMNTVMLKATQADDFIKAVNAVTNLPKDVSDADYAAAEAARMAAFKNFVIIT